MQAALKWKIHYSSAKIIARLARKSNEAPLFTTRPRPTIQCAWTPLTPHPYTTQESSEGEDEKGECKREGLMGDSTDSVG